MPQCNTSAFQIASRNSRLGEISDRETVLSALLRETDRVRRSEGPLCVILFEIDDFAHLYERFGVEHCEQLLSSIVGRTKCLLRSYDLLGSPGMDALLVGLPGCSLCDAVRLAERIRAEVFGPGLNVAGEPIHLTACLGIASSQGRSPLVVLREAEHALQRARERGPDSSQCVYDGPGCFSAGTSGWVQGLSGALVGK
jgi:diguanylate cyclase (GGDEF)-like protein